MMRFSRNEYHMNLHVINSNKSTFYHHAGGSQSQIDYILSSDHELLYNYEIHEKNAINTSSHTSVSATINIQMSRKPKNDTKNEKIYKKLWSKCDTECYRQELTNLKSIIKPNTSSEVKLDILMKQLKKADEIAVPNKIIKLQGLKWKASPEVRPLIQDAKYKHKIWVDHGKPNDNLRNDKMQAQRKLRKQMRKEKYNDRQKLYSEIMDNLSMQKFYQLINRNRNKGVSTNTSLINHNGKEVFEPKEQVKCFAQYMEDLFIPKDNEYDNN